MDLINRYIYAVGKRIPRKQRKDIEKELISSIYDTLEDTYGKKNEYSDDEVESVLRQFGNPLDVATGYQKNNAYLIGPELITPYFMVVKIVSGAVALGLLVSFIVGLLTPELTVTKFVFEFVALIPSLLMGIITAIGFITVIFYLIERNVPGYQLKGVIEKIKWSPKDLPKVPSEKEKISLFESIFGIVVTIIGIILFNFFAEKLGIYYADGIGEKFQFVQIFSLDAIQTYLPFWNIVWVISLVFQIFCLIQREWNIKTRAFELLTKLLSIGILIMMIRGPELIDFKLLLEKSSSEIIEVFTPVVEFFKYSLDGLLIIALVGTCIGILVHAIKILISLSKMSFT